MDVLKPISAEETPFTSRNGIIAKWSGVPNSSMYAVQDDEGNYCWMTPINKVVIQKEQKNVL